jgi:hypothetical protein
MNVRTTLSTRLSTRLSTLRSARRSPKAYRRPAAFLAVAASGALAVNVLTAGQPPAHAAAEQPVSVAAQLGLTGSSAAAPSADAVRSLQALTASRSQRESQTAAAAQAQTMADQAKLAALAAAAQAQAEAQAAAAKAAADQAAAEKAAADKAAADAAAQQQAQQQAAQQAAQQQAQQKAAAVARPSGSFPAYALSKLGGNASQFSCLQSLWGKESGWNPNAQNSSSTAYGIPQFLDSTWAGTGIGKTSDGYRQIDAGLIYIDSRYGSPCGAWAHSRALNWY